jgi:hypothetical protein
MKQIVFKVLTAKDKVERIGMAKMKNGKVKIAFKQRRVQNQLGLEDIVGDGGEHFKPEDGVDYLLALPVAYSGSRLWVEVEEA